MNSVKKFLTGFNLTKNEIEDVLQTCPNLDIFETEHFLKIIALLVKYGYPEDEIDFLILANPSFLLNSTEDLQNILKQLTKNGQDLEELLKNHPYLI